MIRRISVLIVPFIYEKHPAQVDLKLRVSRAEIPMESNPVIGRERVSSASSISHATAHRR